MGFIIKDTGKTFTPAPAGVHIGRCIRIIDLGTQENSYQGKVNLSRQILFQWELPNALMDPDENGKQRPFIVNRRFTASMGEKANLRKVLTSWRGKAFSQGELDAGFDISILVGKPCTLTIIHEEKDGKVYSKVDSVSPPMQGAPIPPASNECFALLLNEDFDPDVFAKLSEKMQEQIKKSPEYMAVSGNTKQPALASEIDDDIPF